jgi:hypothetical protein
VTAADVADVGVTAAQVVDGAFINPLVAPSM